MSFESQVAEFMNIDYFNSHIMTFADLYFSIAEEMKITHFISHHYQDLITDFRNNYMEFLHDRSFIQDCFDQIQSNSDNVEHLSQYLKEYGFILIHGSLRSSQ
jgi:hypothetical protein